MRLRHNTLAVLVFCCLSVGAARGYNEPTDTAGPLNVRIEGPEVVTETETPLAVRVVIENKGDRRVEGTLQLRLIDRWHVEPAGAVPLGVEAGGSTSHEFKVIAGEGTYSAHYPIHALAQFTIDGQAYVAHPILVLETKLAHPPRTAAPVAWKPLPIPAHGEFALWRVPVRRAVVEVFGEQPRIMPVGWQGTEPRSRASLQLLAQTLDGKTRQSLVMHPPWHGGNVGTMLTEVPVVLPRCTPLKLRFAHAVTPTGEGDGVTFRVRAVPFDAPAGRFGEVLFERHSAAKSWQQAEADLSRFAGRAVRLQLESHPGPENNTGWDQSFWAEPLLVAGKPPAPSEFPPKDDGGSHLLGTISCGEEPCEVRLWPGRRGLLDAAVGFRQGDKRLFFHGFEVRVLGARIDDSLSPTVLRETRTEASDGGFQVRHRFDGPASGPFDLVGRLTVADGVFRAKFHLDAVPPARPWHVVYLEDVAAGRWSEPAEQVYAGHGNVVRDPGPVRLNFDGHRLATSFVGFDFHGGVSMVQAVDVPPDRLQIEPTRRHYSLHAPHSPTLTFIPASNVWDAVKVYRRTNALKAAGGVEKLAGRFVFDIWGGDYRPCGEELGRAARYGLTNAAVVWHNWQRWGYDYRLPDIYPANPQYGTHQELREMIETCKQSGLLFALHDNYIDFYPDAAGFSYEKEIAFCADGRPVEAWLNKYRRAQSYRYRADRTAAPLRRNLRLIRDGLAPNAYFIDVWSSIAPYHYWTADGKFVDRVATRDTWARHFAWIRDLLGDDAPQISESGHDQLIGSLDGAQANHLRVGSRLAAASSHGWCVWDWHCADAERTPWFDAAHHDRFILHGAGYPGRYEAGLDGRLHGIYSDDYITTEVLTGRPAMVRGPFDRNVVRKYWLLNDLMRALALRRIEGVEYVDGDLHRQHVRWSGGGQVWVNRGESDWNVAGHVLPQYGFLAQVRDDAGTVEAAIARRDGIICEWARSPEHMYVNGRRVVDRRTPISMSVDKIRLLEDRRLEMSLSWRLDEPIPGGYRLFLHFVDSTGEIVFQGACDAPALYKARSGNVAAAAWASVPGELSTDKTLEIRMGFYRPADGQRLALVGPDDGERRIRIGTLQLDGGADKTAAITWTAHRPTVDPLLLRQNPESKSIGFGPLATAGGYRVSRCGGSLLLVPLPAANGPESPIEIGWAALPWKLDRPTNIESITEDGRVTGRRPTRWVGDAVVIECQADLFGYRLGSRTLEDSRVRP